MKEKQCRHCKYYQRHYIFSEGQLIGIYCGHCMHAKRKRIVPDRQACDQFELGDPDAEMFVRKEYLSKRILEYALSLELLPEICDEEDVCL